MCSVLRDGDFDPRFPRARSGPTLAAPVGGVCRRLKVRKDRMHDCRRWIAGVIVALVVSLAPEWVSAAQSRSAPRGTPPVVVRADVDRLEPDRLVIRGRHFGVESAPTVLLAKTRLDVLSFSDEQIVARLPIDAPPASYLLQVLANGTVASRPFEVTVGDRSRPAPGAPGLPGTRAPS
jgi:hypothetical protein